MSDTRNCFTFIWKIKDFVYTFKKSMQFYSSQFYVQEMFGTNWCLLLYTNSYVYKNCVVCYLERIGSDIGPNDLELDYELSFVIDDGSVIHSQLFRKILFRKDGKLNSALNVNRKEIYVSKRELCIPNDTLTIRCRMWKSQGSMSISARCFAETRIITKCTTFVGAIDSFSSLNPSYKNAISIKSQSDDFRISSMILSVGENNKLGLEINTALYDFEVMHKLNIFILDIFENKVKFCQEEIYDKEPFYVPLIFSRDYLIENKELFLPNDVLTLKCEVIFPARVVPKQIDGIIYEYECQDIQLTLSNSTSPNPSSEEHHTKNITTLKDGLISLFNEGELCDIKLKTATETFPAHKVVLGALSPVFRSMFRTEMREKTNNSVDIEDLDADTVRQMLLFMYSDNLDNLKYESAKSLYFAADKYDIVSLKQKCSNFLKQNLLHTNCCDVLLLADKHQDKDLKRYAQDYIAKNDETVFSSDDWKDLEENHPRLIVETFRVVHSYMKTRRK